MTEGYKSMTTDEQLIDPSRDDVLNAIQYGMQFRHGKASNAARDVAVAALAGMVLEYLELAGFVIKKKPPRRGHSTPPSGYKAHLTE